MLNINLPQNLKDFDANKVVIKCDPKVWKALEEGIKRYNMQAISNAQKLQYFSILPHDFSLATGELGKFNLDEGIFTKLLVFSGPTLKTRRNIVLQKYADIIDRMYNK